MNIKSLESSFLNDEISKSQYISKMYTENHNLLFEYSEFIKNKDIQLIEISDNSVVMTTRELGIKMICNRFDERIAPIEILNFGQYEKEDSDMIFQLINDNDTVFDIGGNMGWYSIALSKAKKNLDIYTFEPIPKSYESLVVNAKLNRSEINIYNIGLSDKKQELTFYYHKEGSGNASSAIMNEDRENIEVRCQVEKLDDFFKDNNLDKLDFIKCDVEGAELLTFKGAVETISKQKPIVFTEMLRKWAAKFNYHPNEIINLFSEMGYRCFFVSNGLLNELKEMTDDTIETNFFFLHTEKHSKEIMKLSNN
ncbi:FkbM family methyltransferase [Marinomonas flavescens]|uniref:FkbM family methyltransferase n=1 Tax=Marinomonas flavescens TaxID=2529379 RepID=UPI001054D0B0|nr:FkbM family methyltransferase [Marinomonas flavescens]